MYILFFIVNTMINDSSNEEKQFLELKFKLNDPNATVPFYATKGAAGLDLCALHSYVLPPMDRILIRTGICIEIPKGYYGRIAPRSGLALKHFVDVGAGVIDEDFRGELQVLLFNFNKEALLINSGERVAQLIFEKYARVRLSKFDQLSITDRGNKGFGSTGTK